MQSNSNLSTRLDTVLAADSRASGPIEQLPGALMVAVVGVLGVDAASLSLASLDLRVPLGASGADAAAAELLQFTLGEGPCLDVLHDDRPVMYDLAQMRRTWPRFAMQLTATTPFRSVASVPLPFASDGRGGAMDLYFRHCEGSTRLDLTAAVAAAEWTVEQLLRSQPASTVADAADASELPWVNGAETRRRMEVWVAIGVLIVDLGLSAIDALAALRLYAQSHHTDLDAVAVDIAAGRLDAQRLRR